MIKQSVFRYRLRDINILLLLWIFVTFLFTLRGVLIEGIYSFLPFLKFYFYEFLCISPWVVGIPIIIKISNRFSLENGVRYFFLHAILALSIFLFHSIVQTFINSVYFDLSFNFENLKNDFLFFLDFRLLLYLGIVIAIGYKEYYRKRGELTIRKQKLKTKLEKARLSAMINGVQPEFLIKNINEVSQIIYQDARKAEELVVCFSDLIRLLVRYTRKVNLTISDDIAPYKIYTQFLSIKLNRAITFEADIKDDVKVKTVPKSFLVIPLLDRIVGYRERKNNNLHTIKYHLVDNGDSLSLNLELSSLCSISEAELKALYDTFIRYIGTYSLHSEDLLIKSLSKEGETVLMKMEIKKTSLNAK